MNRVVRAVCAQPNRAVIAECDADRACKGTAYTNPLDAPKSPNCPNDDCGKRCGVHNTMQEKWLTKQLETAKAIRRDGGRVPEVVERQLPKFVSKPSWKPYCQRQLNIYDPETQMGIPVTTCPLCEKVCNDALMQSSSY